MVDINGFILLIPFLLNRFGLLSMLDKDAVRRAAHFAPLIGNEKIAYWLYQLSTLAIFVIPFFLNVKTNPMWMFIVAISIYGVGIALCVISMVNFASPSGSGFNENGLYGFSRNPMYLAYFVFFMGCVLFTQSLVLLLGVLIFQVSAHWIILAEERWCMKQFGDSYRQYMDNVRRYI